LCEEETSRRGARPSSSSNPAPPALDLEPESMVPPPRPFSSGSCSGLASCPAPAKGSAHWWWCPAAEWMEEANTQSTRLY
jgi:hypothetical protein